jgi:hypothetical protein
MAYLPKEQHGKNDTSQGNNISEDGRIAVSQQFLKSL